MANITALAIAEGYPAEFFGRFHTAPIVLAYPDPEETQEILGALGINELARSVGRADLVDRFSWSPFGLRSLESLYADLLLARHQQHAQPDTCVPVAVAH